jgi:chromosome segregation ATPase
VKRLQDLNQDLNAKLAKLHTVEKEVVEARKALVEQTAELQARLETAQEEANEARESAKSISQKLKQAEKDNEGLEEENNELLSKAAEHEKKVAALSASLADNAKLNAEVQELQQQLTNRVVVSDDKAAQEQIDAGKVEIESLKKHIAEWQALANVSLCKAFESLTIV